MDHATSFHFLFITTEGDQSCRSGPKSINKVAERLQACGHKLTWLNAAEAMNGQLPNAVDLVHTSFTWKVGKQIWPLLQKLEAAGWCFLRPPSLPRGEKVTAHKLLTAAELPLPYTQIVYADTDKEIIPAKGWPCVVKKNYGSRGEGVFMAHTPAELSVILAQIFVEDKSALVQEVIQPLGQDVRALVIGDRMVAAMTRTAPEGDFRANISNGATGVATTLSPMEQEVVMRAVRALNYPLAGVDFARTENGPVIFEVNKGPAFKGLEAATGMDVTSILADYMVQLAQNSQHR